MDPKKVFKKTERGEQEIATRKFGISQDLRHVLIFVDGKSNVSAILKKGAGFPNIEQHLEELTRQGFIQADATVRVSDIKDALIETAQQTLGADAEKIISKLRDAPETKEGLEATISSCKRLVRLVIDEQKADELMNKCTEILARL